ncbi:hypothetical protein L873DRAFT_257953 [Choiromyces venosus 120613-1]|uniref:Uncharacterized protein n=1 Tax=Choiromyces venosus 120613-1 TaxID=1336337 RepID=A0A3N4JDI2_9PEZI|nr:hypothetical protein L873DRAFT_257953 [Choiromyces venosus 120613-1]
MADGRVHCWSAYSLWYGGFWSSCTGKNSTWVSDYDSVVCLVDSESAGMSGGGPGSCRGCTVVGGQSLGSKPQFGSKRRHTRVCRIDSLTKSIRWKRVGMEVVRKYSRLDNFNVPNK